MGASKKLWEEIRQKDLPDWINQSYDLYSQEQQEISEEKIKVINIEIYENIQTVPS